MKLAVWLRKMKISLWVCGILVMLMVPLTGWADDDKSISDELKDLKEQVEELDARLNKAELHTATDKISWGLEFRTRADSIHLKNAYRAPSWLMQGFFGNFNAANYNVMMGAFGTGDFTAFRDLAVSQGMIPAGTPADQFAQMIQSMMTTPQGAQALLPLIGGFNGVDAAQARALMGMIAGANISPDKYFADNDIIFTNRLRLNLKAKINSHLDVGGRLSMYKVFGDSSEVQMMAGAMKDVNLDGNTASVPHGDILHVERIYFNWKQDFGSVPFNFSLGRRPATDGPPLEYGQYSLEGGSPLGTIINWQFDGASMNFGLEYLTGIPGAAFKLCYGVGFESDYGNSYSLNGGEYVDDATFGGFIASFYDDEVTSVVLNYAHAWNITDGFTGTVVMPFLPFKQADGTYTFTPNTGGFISRMEAATNIGDFDLASLLFRTNLAEKFADIDIFLAPSWSRTDPSQISKNPFYELMGQGLVSTADANGNLESHNGYSIYAGILFPMPKDARFGLEYNWGSEYWLNMTGAEDSMIASKLSTRGQVYEAYYIQPIYDHNLFVKLGGQYYDYEYTGSGNPLGAPVKIDEMKALDALFPVIDTAWNAYLSMTVRF